MIKLLERYFEMAVEAPDGIKKLREMILTLAMQGKLVRQDPGDQPASRLLKEIEADKIKLIKGGKTSQKESLQVINPEEMPYELPYSWEWVRLDQVSEYIQRGKGPRYSDEVEIPVISQKCIQWTGFDKNRVNFIAPDTLYRYRQERLVRYGDLLWNSTGTGTIGRINIYKDELSEYPKIVADSHVTVVRTIRVNAEYVLFFLMSPIVQRNLEDRASGTTNQIELTTSMVRNQIIALPPLREQKRIVAKIDQLMSFCDKLESERDERNTKRLKANSSAIKNLLESSNNAEFNKSWHFITRNFNELYSVPENLGELKKAILQLAMMGKLVPQDPNDQPASEILRALESEKGNRLNVGRINSEDLLQSAKQDKMQYELPKSWELVPLGAIAQHNSGKTLDSGRNIGSRREYITTSNLYWGFFALDELRQMPIRDEELEKCSARKGDLLICEGGEAGRAAVWDYPDEVCFQNHIHRVRFYGGINPFFGYRLFEKLNSTGEINQYRKGVAISNMSGKALASIPFPLPPLAEQNRIVSKIDQLFDICNDLKQEITLSIRIKEKILNAILSNP